jgi:hypothetical protein
MILDCIALKDFSSMRYGNVKTGDTLPLDSSIAKQMTKGGYVKFSESTVEKLNALKKSSGKKDK